MNFDGERKKLFDSVCTIAKLLEYKISYGKFNKGNERSNTQPFFFCHFRKDLYQYDIRFDFNFDNELSSVTIRENYTQLYLSTYNNDYKSVMMKLSEHLK